MKSSFILVRRSSLGFGSHDGSQIENQRVSLTAGTQRPPPDSPFRKFDVKCLKCGSYRLSLRSEFDDEAGELRLVLGSAHCRVEEVLRVRQGLGVWVVKPWEFDCCR